MSVAPEMKSVGDIEWLKDVDTPTLSNAIERLRVRPQNTGFAPLQLKSLFPDFGRMYGYAVTAQVETMTEVSAADVSLFVKLCEALKNSPRPAVIAFQETGPQPDFAAHCGEVMATVFKRLGAVGLISDAGVRDVPEVRAMGFHYFARGTVASHAFFRIVRINVPIQVCGLPIAPGQLLHGDVNGLLVVPIEGLVDLKSHVDAVRTRERHLMNSVRAADFSVEKLAKILV